MASKKRGTKLSRYQRSKAFKNNIAGGVNAATAAISGVAAVVTAETVVGTALFGAAATASSYNAVDRFQKAHKANVRAAAVENHKRRAVARKSRQSNMQSGKINAARSLSKSAAAKRVSNGLVKTHYRTTSSGKVTRVKQHFRSF